MTTAIENRHRLIMNNPPEYVRLKGGTWASGNNI
jgi:hypothetical protein